MLTALIILAIIIIAILAMAATRPNEFSMVRSADLRTSPEKVFAQLNDFKNWKAWSRSIRLARCSTNSPSVGLG